MLVHLTSGDIRKMLKEVLNYETQTSAIYKIPITPDEPRRTIFGLVYNRSEHTWLKIDQSDAARYRLVRVRRRQTDSTIIATVDLTHAGHRAIKMLPYDGTWDTKAECVDLDYTLMDHRLRLHENYLEQHWVDMILRTEHDFLQPLREEVMAEILRRKVTSDGVGKRL